MNRRESVGKMKGQDFGTVLKKYRCVSIGTNTVLQRTKRGTKKEQKGLDIQILQKFSNNVILQNIAIFEHQRRDLEVQLDTFINLTC